MEASANEPAPALPERFERLADEIVLAWTLNYVNPKENPRLKIGRFEGLRVLGHGSFGVVFKVYDPRLGRDVALKLFATAGLDAAEWFHREVQVLAKFSHPNIVRVYETGEFNGDLFFVMELIEGITGHQFIRDWEGIDEVLEVYEAAGVGLAVAHDEGVLHRDFKPSNVLLGFDGRTCVADFGLATLIAEHSDDGEERHRIGTRAYMAPEILRGEVGDARSDQWSFCVALWETLFATRPFAGETIEELLAAIERGELEMGEVSEFVPEAVRAVVRVGLSIDPDDRYPSMWALITALRMLRAREPAPGRRRAYFWAMAVAFAGVLGAVGSAAVLRGGEQAEPPAPAPEPAEAAEPTVVDPVLQHVLGLIAADRFEEAQRIWEEEVVRRRTMGISTGADSLRISAAFLERAEALELVDPERSFKAVTAAVTWKRIAGMGPSPSSD